MIIIYFIFILIFFSTEITYSNDFDYDDSSYTTSRKLYLHPLTHYNYSAEENYIFEKKYMNGYAYRTSVGSISGKEFFLNQELILNHKLNEKYWFRTYIFDEDGFHLKETKVERYLELQRDIGNNFFISTLWNYSYRKDQMDGGIGIMKSDSKRENFVKLDFIWEDFIYNGKNVEFGHQKKDSYGINFLARYRKEHLYLFSKGNFSTGYSRTYKNNNLITENKRKNYFLFKINSIKKNNLGYKFEFSEFHKKQNYVNAEENYIFDSLYFLNNINWKRNLSKISAIFTELNIITRFDDAEGYKNYKLNRYELIPVCGWLYKKDKNEFDLSLRSALMNVEQNSSTITGSRHLFASGFKHNFSENGFIRFSVSFFIRERHFGGGSMRMGYYF